MLGAERGRAKFLARLGPEANDALDEFLNLALDYERRETPSLQGFVAWLRAAQSEVKRDMEMVRDEVRVMTVHGAKGLEAHTVILADTTTPPTGPRDPRLLALRRAARWCGRPRAAMTSAPWPMRAADAQQAARDEYRRLLYVAMTRAEERLVIAGTQGRNKVPDGCWYQLVERRAAEATASARPADDGDGDVLRFRKGPSAEAAAEARSPAATAPPPVPDWLRRQRQLRSSPACAPSRRRAPRRTRRRPAGLRLARRGAAARLAHAPAAAIAAGYRRREKTRRRRKNFWPARGEELAEDVRRKIEEEVDVLLGHARLRRAVRARQPRRSADRRQAYPRW